MAKRQVPLSAASAAVSPKRHKTLTSHCLRVYALCKRVPRGRFTTYGRLAAAAGSSARAVGNALRHNPFAPIVPCHRVLKSDFSLGGFSGQTDPLSNEVCRKRELLKEEGVPLEKDSVRVSERARLVFDFDGARVSEGEMSPDALRVA